MDSYERELEQQRRNGRNYYKRHRDKILAKQKEYYKQNRAEILRKQKVYRDNRSYEKKLSDSERMHAYYLQHRDECKRRSQEWRRRQKEKAASETAISLAAKNTDASQRKDIAIIAEKKGKVNANN